MPAVFAGLRPRSIGRLFLSAATAAVLIGGGALLAAAQDHAAEPPLRAQAPAPPHASPSTHEPKAPASGHEPVAGAHGASTEHEESIWPQVGKIVNFVILVGTIVYFGRKPLTDYLAGRRHQVRADLVTAEEMKKTAAAQIAGMDARLKALPAELEALKARGREEIAAEERRIRNLAEVERTRLLEHAEREIEQRTRVAQRELVELAAALAVGLAEKKISAQITDADRARLVDLYLVEVKSHE